MRYVRELGLLIWGPTNIVFLDEVSFDNRDCWRTHGYSPKGAQVAIRGEYRRLPRVSLLTFINVWGVKEIFMTEGTFTNMKFAQACRNFFLSGEVDVYPGRCSIWIMDGARIHCNSHLIGWLRKRGIVVVFLPAYCPFYNPIEMLFGTIKRAMRRIYTDDRAKQFTAQTLSTEILKVMFQFTSFSLVNYFKHCGYLGAGQFDWKKSFGKCVRPLEDVDLVLVQER